MMYILLALFALAAAAVGALVFGRSRGFASASSSLTRDPIERLEGRIAPAAIAVLQKGLLTISGDADAGGIIIAQNADGTISVYDGISEIGTYTAVRSIVAKAQGTTAYDISLVSGGITGALSIIATGPSEVGLAGGSVIGGAFSFIGEASAQSLIVRSGVSIGGALNFNAGTGNDTFLVEKNTVVGGSATFTNVEKGDFTGDGAVTIQGALAFKNSAVIVPVDIGVESGGLAVDGKVTYAGGKAADVVTFGGVFQKDIAFTDPAGDNSFVLFSSGLLVKGSVAVTTGGGNDRFNIPGGQVNGDLVLKLGNGNNRFNFGFAGLVTISGGMTMITGSGDDLISSSGLGLMIGKNLVVQLGDGADEIDAAIDIKGRTAFVDMGGGADKVGLYGSPNGSPRLAITLNFGAGDDDFKNMFPSVPSALFIGGGGADRFRISTFTAPVVTVTGFEVFG